MSRRPRLPDLPSRVKIDVRGTLERARAERACRREATRRSAYLERPLLWIEDCVTWPAGTKLASYQERVIGEFYGHRREAVRAPRDAGKSVIAALLTLHFALTRDELCQQTGENWKIITTASVWRQLSRFLWPEIHKWARRLKWETIGRPPLDLRRELTLEGLRLARGEAFPIASDKPEATEGGHADHLLFILDEAKAIPAAFWDSAEGAMMKGQAYALALSTPGEPSGRFYEIHSRQPGYEDWYPIHITLAECLAAYRESGGHAGVDPARAEQRRLQWGEQSAVYRCHVLGEFATQVDGLIPLAWVEAAFDRWRDLTEAGQMPPGPLTALGVDVGISADKTVLASRVGAVIIRLDVWDVGDSMETAGRAVSILRSHGGRAVVDADGVGNGTYSRLAELGFDPIPFHAARRTDVTDVTQQLRFANLRAAGWWHVRELLDPANRATLALPPDDLLIGELTAPTWKLTSAGKILVEGKPEIRKRLNRSTDRADAVMHAMALDLLESGDSPEALLDTYYGARDSEARAVQEHASAAKIVEDAIKRDGMYWPGGA